MNEEQSRALRWARLRLQEALSKPHPPPVTELIAAHEQLERAGYRGPMETVLEAATSVVGHDTTAAARAALAVDPGDTTILVATQAEAARLAPTLREMSELVTVQHDLGAELLAVVPSPRSAQWALDASTRLRREILNLNVLATAMTAAFPVGMPSSLREAHLLTDLREALHYAGLAAESLRAAGLRMATLPEPP